MSRLYPLKEKPKYSNFKEIDDAIEDAATIMDNAHNEVEELYRQLGLLIRSFRCQRKIGLRTLAEKLGISASYLSDIELNRRSPGYDVMQKILKLK